MSSTTIARVTGWVAIAQTDNDEPLSSIGIFASQDDAIQATVETMALLFRPGGDLEGAEDEVRSHLRTEGWYRDGQIVNRIFRVTGAGMNA